MKNPSKRNKQNKQTVKIIKKNINKPAKGKYKFIKKQDVAVKKILCNYTSIGLHEFSEDRHTVNVSMNMKGNQTPGTSKTKRLFKWAFGVRYRYSNLHNRI